jgi:hypothetical protein
MRRLERHYTLNVPPVLLLETLADLKRDTGDAARSQALVTALARRMLRGETRFNMHHREICAAELSGFSKDRVEMYGVPILGPGKNERMPDGRICKVYDVSWQNRVLIKWIDGAFSEAEHLIALEWRETSYNIEVQAYERRLNDQYVIIPRANDLGDVVNAVDNIVSNPRMQDFCLNWLMDELSLNRDVRAAIQMRWRMRSTAYLKDFAPYAHFCVRVNLAFVFGLIRGLISSNPEKKTRVDLEYCYYLPFCMVFASSDGFHGRFAPLLLKGDQDFLDGSKLKADLKRLDEEWQSLTAEQKRQRDNEYGDHPVENPESVTWQIWRKRMRPRTASSGNAATSMTREAKDEFVKQIRSVSDAASGKSTAAPSSSLDDEEANSVLIKMIVPRSEITERFPDFEDEERRTADTEKPTP